MIRERKKEEKGINMNEKEMDLERILEEKSIYSVFQPILSLKTGEVLGYEALSRMKEPGTIGGIEELFDMAVLYDRIWKLEKLCRKKAFENFSLQPDYKDKKLFVNVNPLVIKDKKFRIGFTDEHLMQYYIKKENIVFEITEKGNIQDLEGFQKAVEHYRKQNYRIAMDDVGAGNSGLTMICDLSPEYLKLDMKLIRDIHKNELKRAIVNSMVELSKSTGIQLIAEGIETEKELQTLINLGIQYGQGYFLQRPNKQMIEVDKELIKRIRLLSGADVKIVKDIEDNSAIKDNTEMTIENGIGTITKPCQTFSPEVKGEFVYEYFKKNLCVAEICIVDREGHFIGCVTKARAIEKFGGLYGYSLNARKSISDLIVEESLVVDSELSIEAVTRIAMNRSPNQLYDAIVVTKEDRFLGIVTLRELVLTFISIELKKAEDENPLTRLPGNSEINQRINRAIKKKEPFSIMYFDMDNFKSYNDAYGFGNGDKMICQMAKSIQSQISKKEFLGHIGGDDFVVVVPHWDVKKIHEKIVKDFHENIKPLYNEKDWNRGYIKAKGRDGVERKFGIVTISTSVISNQKEDIKNDEEISLQIAKLKKESKHIEGNSFLMI